jgi:hypothetical protein
MADQLVKRAVAALQLDVSPQTVSKVLPTIRVGGAVRVRQSDIDAIIQQGTASLAGGQEDR